MLIALLRAEAFKAARRAMLRVLLLILVAGVLGLYGLLWMVVNTETEGMSAEALEELRESLRVEAVRGVGLDLVRSLGTVLVVILGVSTISSEYFWGTIRLLVPRAGCRAALLTAKYLLLALFVALVVLLGYLVALAASFVVSSAEGLGTGLGERFLPRTLAALLRTALVMLPYVALGVLIAVLTRSTAAGIAITLSVYFLEGLGVPLVEALGSPFNQLPELLLSENVQAVMRANAVDEPGLTDAEAGLPSAWRAAGVLVAYTAGFVALAYRRFLARDITVA